MIGVITASVGKTDSTRFYVPQAQTLIYPIPRWSTCRYM